MRQRAAGTWISARMTEGRSVLHEVSAKCEIAVAKISSVWSALQGAERHARSAVRAADAEYRDCSCSDAEREAESHACKCTLVCLPGTLMPNPSLKRSANGRPPGPVWRYAVHFRQPGPGVLPSSPA